MSSPPKNIVVLVHGILGGAWQWWWIGPLLEEEGFEVVNWVYPSNQWGVEEASLALEKFLVQQKLQGQIHFVGFSMGCVIIRHLLSHWKPPHFGRCVLIAPPNHGSGLAQWISRRSWGRAWWGEKALRDLCPESPLLQNLPLPSMVTGIIAGGLGVWPGFNPFLPGDNDGCVPLESARLSGVSDFIQIKGQHTLLLFLRSTAREVVSFLKEGRFESTRPTALGEKRTA